MTWYVFRSTICDNIICYLKNHCPQIYVFLKPGILLNLPKLIPMDVKDPSVFVLFVCYISQIILNSLSIVNHTLAPNSERKRCILFFISKGSCTNIISSFRLHQIFKIYSHLTVLALRSPCESGHGLMDLIQKAFNNILCWSTYG